MAKKARQWSTDEIEGLLESRYAGGAWAVLFQVPNGTAGGKSRTADALAMGLWPSQGLHLHGHEIKVSRSDWQKEMQDVAKAEAIAHFCHFWWLVAPEHVAKLEEIPPLWGWMVPTGSGLRVRKPAGIRTDRQSPDDHFLAALFRVMVRDINRGASAQEIRKAREDGERAAKEHRAWTAKSQVERAERDARELRETIETFKAASGIDLRSWENRLCVREIAKAVQLIVDGGDPLAALKGDLERFVRHADNLREAAVTALAELPAGEEGDAPITAAGELRAG
ncbi:MAG: hypothetical protein WD066_18860 [Planctomycetaceae bacterium]